MKKMNTSNCGDVNHFDSDALLPPRKRLLAGLKRQSSDINNHTAPSTSHGGDFEFTSRFNTSLKARLDDPRFSNDDIVEASKSDAIEAAKNAELARAKAETKAAKAAKAMAAARSALDLVAILSERAAKREKSGRRIKMKKHATVEAVYSKNKGDAKSRILTTVPSKEDNDGISRVGLGSETQPNENTTTVNGETNTNGTDHQLGLGNSDLVSVHKFVESSGKKKSQGMKKRKLPLSICSSLNEDQNNIKTQHSEEVSTGKEPSFSPETLATSTWKCQTFKVPSSSCVTQNKVMEL